MNKIHIWGLDYNKEITIFWDAVIKKPINNRFGDVFSNEDR